MLRYSYMQLRALRRFMRSSKLNMGLLSRFPRLGSEERPDAIDKLVQVVRADNIGMARIGVVPAEIVIPAPVAYG